MATGDGEATEGREEERMLGWRDAYAWDNCAATHG